MSDTSMSIRVNTTLFMIFDASVYVSTTYGSAKDFSFAFQVPTVCLAW